MLALAGLVWVMVLVAQEVPPVTLWQWRHQTTIWLEIYLLETLPSLLIASWLVASAIAVAAIALATAEMRRLMA